MTQTLPGAAPRRGVLSIDEGTTGTRAGVVLDSGAVHEVFYQSIEVSHPDNLSVEQDPMEIWTATVEVARRAVGRAEEEGIEIAAVAVSTQRATAMLWDRVTGRPLLPAVVWGIGQAFGLSGVALSLSVLFMALPTAASAYIMARQMGGDAPLMASITTTQHLACALTLPVVIALVG
mgnify:CR=1 FL=1